MTDKQTEALKLALEALEINLIFLGKVSPAQGQEDLLEDCLHMTAEQIAAIREALAEQPNIDKYLEKDNSEQPAQQPNEADELIRNLGFDPERFRTEAGFINHMKLRAAIKHPEEYQASMQPMYQKLTNCVLCGRLNPKEGACNHGLEQPAQQQEPVAEVKLKERGGNVGIATVIHEIFDPMREPLRVGDKLYTSPPASKPWVGLTEEETGHWAADFLAGAKWAEAKLREKNA